MEFLRIKKDILAALTYFNMFNYPLKKREIYIFLGNSADPSNFEKALNCLISESAIFKLGEFYCLFNNYAFSERRKRGNEKAARMLVKAEKAAKLIAAFPFVRGVAVSGSLSKKFADEDTDIDFFIITAANRLWIARTLLHIFKKITFLVNLQHSFCMNYFIDESAPCILEKNIYTATEVATILPVVGLAVFEKFYAANRWIRHYLPNNYMHIPAAAEIRKNHGVRIIEKIADNRLGNVLDTLLMNKTAKNWNKKTKNNKRNSKGILLRMHVDKHFSKPNPGGFQKKLLERYETCLGEVFARYELSVPVRNKFL